MPALASLSEEEIDFLFTVPGIITAEGTRALNLEYEVKSDPAAGMKSLPALLKGITTGKLRPASMAAIARAGLTASIIKRLYEQYPDHPMAFSTWMDRVGPQWTKADKVRHGFFEKLLREWT
jgi:hypothetical protein